MSLCLKIVWKKSIEKYHQGLIEKSNHLYKELLKNEIMPQIVQESEEELTVVLEG
ncbi:hypothetical protein [Bacillus testis]|uniref:hypothetical protein n=1 Tax=Bacillus testis TaxID=1622072 RepID=UPI000ACD6124|nr:hypothetical protein [Bacillus testis]